MKKILMLIALLCGALMLAGCGDKVDESKTPEQIREEIQNMDLDEIRAVIEDYQKAIEKKAAELKKEVDKLAAIPLTEQLGDEAGKLRDGIRDIKDSLEKLQANMAAYAEGLKK